MRPVHIDDARFGRPSVFAYTARGEADIKWAVKQRQRSSRSETRSVKHEGWPGSLACMAGVTKKKEQPRDESGRSVVVATLLG